MSVIALFKLLKTNKDILFSVNGHYIGKFHYFCTGCKFFNHEVKFSSDCIAISVNDGPDGSVTLEDYFYEAEKNASHCEMKPTTKAEHQMIVGTLLEFLAYAFKTPVIMVNDDASRKYKYCPPLHTGFHLVAGLESFYEKMAGFKSPEAVDDARELAQRTPTFPTSRGTTWGEVAKNLVEVCKAEKEKITKEDRIAIRKIQKPYIDTGGMGGLEYEKTFTGRYRCRIQHADEIHDRHLVTPTDLLPNEEIKKYMSIDIGEPFYKKKKTRSAVLAHVRH